MFTSPAFRLAFCLVILHSSFFGIDAQEDGFNNFLTLAMQDFSEWLISNELDPTPVITSPVNISTSEGFINITGEVKNQILKGHSGEARSHIESNLIKGHFRIVLYYSCELGGDYIVEGSVLSSIPVSGSGNFSIKPMRPYDQDSYVIVEFDGFGITPDGYIDLSVARFNSHHYLFYLNEEQAKFEGLGAGGYESSVIQSIIERQKSQVNEWHPLHGYIKTYLQELFSATPLSEIIGTTLRPPTTPTIPTTTTLPTCPPCFGKEDQFTTIHNERVLERKMESRPNGRRVVITRKLMEITVEDEIE